jgi:hypothetical protein
VVGVEDQRTGSSGCCGRARFPSTASAGCTPTLGVTNSGTTQSSFHDLTGPYPRPSISARHKRMLRDVLRPARCMGGPTVQVAVA